MALTQDERISISKKLIDIPVEDAQSDLIQAQLEAVKGVAEKEDAANKTLMDEPTTLINLYQSELQRYDGNGRTQLAEQDIIDSADKILQNPFFPNDSTVPLPNIPDGVWKNFTAFSGNKAIGKNYNESYTPVQKEQDLIDAINAAIATAQSFSEATQGTGKSCEESGSCSMPEYDNQTDCENNGGTWTASDNITSDAAMVAAMDALKSAVQAWEDFMNTTYAVIPTAGQDADATRLTQNNASRQSITDTIADVDIWQAYPDFDTTTSLPTTCAGFNALGFGDLVSPIKLNPTSLSVLQNAMTARTTFINSTRIGQITTILGSVTQDFDSGEILATSGFYGTRFRFIDMRLNLIRGSLNKLKGIENGQLAQEEAKQANASAAIALSTVMVASRFRAPSTGTSVIHLLDASGFSPGDSAYIVANTQQEIAVTINSITGNAVFLDTNIPKKYREIDGARLYKEL